MVGNADRLPTRSAVGAFEDGVWGWPGGVERTRRPRTLYAGNAGGSGVFKSTDGGGTWSAINTGLPDNSDARTIYTMAIDPTTPTTLYAGSLTGLFKSTDAGAHWQTTTGLANGIIALAIDLTAPGTLYAGTGTFVFGSCLEDCPANGVFKSTDGGGSWQAIGLTSRGNVSSLFIDPRTPRTLYAGTTGLRGFGDLGGHPGLFKSTDDGGTWSDISTGVINAPVGQVAIDPTKPSTLYAASSVEGAFRSTDRGGHLAGGQYRPPYWLDRWPARRSRDRSARH